MQMLTECFHKARRLIYRKAFDAVDILKILDKIIPHEYFGCSKHRSLFYSIVTRILTCSIYECVYYVQLVVGYDYSKIQWLRGLQHTEQKNLLLKVPSTFLRKI